MRVLCINGDFTEAANREWFKHVKEVPIELENYFVVEVKDKGGKTGYILEEIDGGVLPNGEVVTFDNSRFVVVEEEKESESEIIELEFECLHLT